MTQVNELEIFSLALFTMQFAIDSQSTGGQIMALFL
jgi:hypothetical protein